MKRSLIPCTVPALTLVLLSLAACQTRPKGSFTSSTYQIVDYSKENYWAALPWRSDKADTLPDNSLNDRQDSAEVDVFFIHPTTYGYRKGNTAWNASVQDQKLNERTDASTITYQATIFNGVGRVFAPRYRQAHLHSYYAIKKGKHASDGIAALKYAYRDVARAFDHYLKNWNNGRPVIIAAHSQGSTHGIMLLKQFFDGKPLREQLVAAYLVGMPVERDTFETIPVCKTPTQTGCFCSWRTVKRGKHIDWEGGTEYAVTNPLTWTTDTAYAADVRNRGAVLRPFGKLVPSATDAQVTRDGFLWASKPRFPWSWLWLTKNYHIADYNFYYLNVRKNARARTRAFFNE